MGKILYYLGCATSVAMLSTGCASGGFKLTREYATFVNHQPVILRVILYILTAVVFAVTLLIDVVINNTLDFWGGRVSAGTYNFHEGKRTFVVRHEYVNGLRRTTIQSEQQVVLSETPSGAIEVSVDGVLRGRVKNLREIPVASHYDAKGVYRSRSFL